MPGAVLPEVRLAEDQAPRKKITRQEAQFLADNGFLTTRWELLDGEIVLKMPQNAPHRITLFLIAVWLEQVFGRPFVVTQQGVEVRKADQTTNYPEPDVSVLTRPAPEFTQGDPTAAETHLIVEVADSTLSDDKRIKAELYGRSGYGEYWIADVNAKQIIIHRDPTPNGYSSIVVYSGDEEVSPLAKPDAKIAVSALFPADDEQN